MNGIKGRLMPPFPCEDDGGAGDALIGVSTELKARKANLAWVLHQKKYARRLPVQH